MEQQYWIEFLSVQLEINIGIHDHEKNSRQRVIVDIRARLAKQNADSFFDYDVLEEFLRLQVREKTFDYQEELASCISAFILSHATVEYVDIAVSKPNAYTSGITPGVRLITARDP